MLKLSKFNISKIRKLLFILSLIVFFSCSKDSSSSSEITQAPPVIQYTLTVSAQSGGSVNNEGGSYVQGSTFSVTATPDSNYEFTGWTGIESSENPLSINVNSNLNLQANFKKKTYPLTVNISGNGSVKEEIVSTTKSTNYEVGTTIRLTPIPIADETIFLKWAGDLTGSDSPVEITVDQPKTVTATFEFAVYNGVVGKWKVKKEKTGTSKNFEIDYIIFNSDFTYEVGLVNDADFNDTALVSGTFDIISNEKIEFYQVIGEVVARGGANNIKLDLDVNTISFELDLTIKVGDFVGTIKQTVDNAAKDLNYDPVTKSTIKQTTTSVTTTSTTSTNTTGTSTDTTSPSNATPDSGSSTGTTTSTNSSQDSQSFVIQVLLFENNSSDYRVLLSEDRLGGLNSDIDPDLNFYVGDRISFEVNTPGHPFYLKTFRGTGNSNLISGVANNGTTNGTVSWTPTSVGTFYYQCSLHNGMVGKINITN